MEPRDGGFLLLPALLLLLSAPPLLLLLLLPLPPPLRGGLLEDRDRDRGSGDAAAHRGPEGRPRVPDPGDVVAPGGRERR